jgi:hypothetical protein
MPGKISRDDRNRKKSPGRLLLGRLAEMIFF